MPSINIQKVTTEQEFEQLFSLILALAEFEELPLPNNEAKLRLKNDCLSSAPRFEAFLAFSDSLAVAYAIILETYSSFLAKPTLYLEDIFVLPEYRRKKIGEQFFSFLASLANKKNCGRMEWCVLDWNLNAQNFYRKFGATHLKEWHYYRLTEEDLKKMFAR
jgi:GNAT superfamily N-acetyltransferase